MPLIFDMPLDQLQTYQGTNPRPADFDAYWDRGLAEMRAVDPRVELVPADFQTPFAECSTSTSPASAARASTPSSCGRARHTDAAPGCSAVPRLLRGTRGTGRTSWPSSPWATRWRRWTAAGRAGSPRTPAACWAGRLPRPHRPRAWTTRPRSCSSGRSTWTPRNSPASSWTMPEVDAERVGAMGVAARAAG